MEQTRLKGENEEGDIFERLVERIGMDGKCQTRFNLICNMGFALTSAGCVRNIFVALADQTTGATLRTEMKLTTQQRNGGVAAFRGKVLCPASPLAFMLDARVPGPVFLPLNPFYDSNFHSVQGRS
jgi:hypothetical protein